MENDLTFSEKLELLRENLDDYSYEEILKNTVKKELIEFIDNNLANYLIYSWRIKNAKEKA